MERFKLVSRTPVVDSSGCWTAHGLRTMLALIQATGGQTDGVIPLPADAELVDVILDIQQLYALSGEINSKASQGVQASKKIDSMLDPSALVGMVNSVKSEIHALRNEVATLKNVDYEAKISGLLAEIKNTKSKLNEVEELCQSFLGVL